MYTTETSSLKASKADITKLNAKHVDISKLTVKEIILDKLGDSEIEQQALSLPSDYATVLGI
jgi:hypothetical protein